MGRQHGNGIVKTTQANKILPTPKPIINSPPKHTHHNRSKSMGKCGRARCVGIGCHVCRSKDKAYKGTYKLRSCDVGLNHRLISWRVVDNKGLHQLNYVGVSATQVLNQLKNHYYDDNDQDFDDDDDQFVGVNGDYEDEDGVSDGLVMRSIHVEDKIVHGADDDEMGDLVEEDGIVRGEDEDEDEGEVSDDEMGDFCDVGYFVIEQLDGDEDWCLVGEL